jgi:ribosomal protein S18 acetylase RimI-like enzyme
MFEYKLNCEINPEQVAKLRKSVGWNGRLESCKKSLQKSYLYICCFNGYELIGFVDVVSNGVTDAYIQDLVVEPSYQKKGIGKNLMNMAIEKLKNDGVYYISVMFDESLLGFYKKFNFHIMMSGYLETRKEE